MKEILIRNAFLTGIALAFTGMTQVTYNIVIGKNFGAESLGNLSIILSVSVLFASLISMITESSASKFLSEYLAKNDTVSVKFIFSFLLLVTILGSFILTIVMIICRSLLILRFNLVKESFGLTAFLFLFISFHHFFRGCFYGLNKINKYTRFEIISSILFFLVLGIIALVIRNYLLLPFFVYYAFFIILSAYSLKDYFNGWNYSPGIRKAILEYGILGMIGTLASTAKANLAILFTGFYLSPQQVGYYSAAVSITLAIQFAPSIMGRVLLPAMSSAYGMDDRHTLTKLLDRTTQRLSIAALFIGGIFIISSQEILQKLFSNEFAVATISLQMLILGACLSFVTVPSISALSGTKYIMVMSKAAIFGLLISLALWISLIPRFGINGTALGYIVGVFFTVAIPLYYSHKYFGLNIHYIYRNTFLFIIIYLISDFAGTVSNSHSHLISASVFIMLFILIFNKNLYEIYMDFDIYIRLIKK